MLNLESDPCLDDFGEIVRYVESLESLDEEDDSFFDVRDPERLDFRSRVFESRSDFASDALGFNMELTIGYCDLISGNPYRMNISLSR